MKWNCPIVICAYNRPNLFERCLKAVKEIPEVVSGEVDVYVFCDGGEEATQYEIFQIIHKLGGVKHESYQPSNLCIAHHVHEIRRTMFDIIRVERMMFLEDDIIVSPYYYRFMNGSLDIFLKADPTVAVINSSCVCLESLEQKQKKQRDFSDSLSHLNNYIMTRRAWKVINPIMTEYFTKFLMTGTAPYKKIKHDAIMEWARSKIELSDAPTALHPKTRSNLTSSQDSITNMALRIHNMKYMSSYVNRVLNIGENGFHYHPKFFEQVGFDKMVLDILEKDAEPVVSVWDMDAYCEYML